MKIVPIIIGMLVIAGICAMSGCVDILETGTPPAQTVPPTQTYQQAEFDITPSAVSADCTLNSAEDAFTVAYYSDKTNDLIYDGTNGSFSNFSAKFIIEPIPWVGANAENLCTIYYECTNPSISIDEDDTYYLITKSGNKRQVLWITGGQTKYIEGSGSMLLTGTVVLYCNITSNFASLTHADDFSSNDVELVFHNGDWTWSQTILVKYLQSYSWGA